MTLNSGLFFRRLLDNPRQVSAIAPSSRFLAKAMTKTLNENSGLVVEFGPGTGRLTEAIIAAGVLEKNLICFELDPTFARHIQSRWPNATVLIDGAQNAAKHISQPVGAIISGLPLLSMPTAVRRAIVRAAFDILAPGGSMFQFTYGRKPALSAEELDQLKLKVERGELVLRNLPPARVMEYKRL